MAQVPIASGDLFQGGRIQSQDASIGPTFLRYVGDVTTTDEYLFQFPQGAGVGLTFGIAKSLFVDNSNNAGELLVTVSGTRQTFPVPAFSTGWWPLNAQDGSFVTVTSNAAASGIEFIFYNYDQVPFVYYKFGLSQVTVVIPDGADVAFGETTDAAETNPAATATGISLFKGLLTRLIPLGLTTDPTITNNATNTTLIGYIRGILYSLKPALFANNAGAGTDVIMNGDGMLCSINVNTPDVGGTITVYDNTAGSGTKIATIDASVIGAHIFNCAVGTGITCVVVGAAVDYTVSYKD